MNEKILIKSKMDKKAKTVFLVLIGMLFLVSIILFLALATEWKFGSGKWTSTASGYQVAINPYYDDGGKALACLITACSSFLLGSIVSIVYLIHRKCELTITEKNVRGKAIFGKEVVLPVYMISAYSTRSFMSTVSIATSSGLTKFAFIENYAEIEDVLSQKINERQENTAKAEPVAETAKEQMDDLFKLKNLLDQGIITQEEFDAKKKQLLGL